MWWSGQGGIDKGKGAEARRIEPWDESATTVLGRSSVPDLCLCLLPVAQRTALAGRTREGIFWSGSPTYSLAVRLHRRVRAENRDDKNERAWAPLDVGYGYPTVKCLTS